jgi:hypothetical protein
VAVVVPAVTRQQIETRPVVAVPAVIGQTFPAKILAGAQAPNQLYFYQTVHSRLRSVPAVTVGPLGFMLAVMGVQVLLFLPCQYKQR